LNTIPDANHHIVLPIDGYSHNRWLVIETRFIRRVFFICAPKAAIRVEYISAFIETGLHSLMFYSPTIFTAADN
jgi:hypothetical protein